VLQCQCTYIRGTRTYTRRDELIQGETETLKSIVVFKNYPHVRALAEEDLIFKTNRSTSECDRCDRNNITVDSPRRRIHLASWCGWVFDPTTVFLHVFCVTYNVQPYIYICAFSIRLAQPSPQHKLNNNEKTIIYSSIVESRPVIRSSFFGPRLLQVQHSAEPPSHHASVQRFVQWSHRARASITNYNYTVHFLTGKKQTGTYHSILVLLLVATRPH